MKTFSPWPWVLSQYRLTPRSTHHCSPCAARTPAPHHLPRAVEFQDPPAATGFAPSCSAAGLRPPSTAGSPRSPTPPSPSAQAASRDPSRGPPARPDWACAADCWRPGRMSPRAGSRRWSTLEPGCRFVGQAAPREAMLPSGRQGNWMVGTTRSLPGCQEKPALVRKPDGANILEAWLAPNIFSPLSDRPAGISGLSDSRRFGSLRPSWKTRKQHSATFRVC
mmetsp:Transcript_64732/g.173377  ORF Transcript_64732/g.173377 Transcript_64732/m.173377 type:complete len:222 (-) Transcript_64732:1655-2320(-)